MLLFLLTGVLLSLGKLLFSDYVFFHAISPEQLTASNEPSLGYVLVNVKDMSFIVALFATVKFARDRYILESNIRELENKGLEAEIRLVEHHMDPHVIFNNFNNLYSISIYKPQFLRSTVKSLRSILNYLFKESKQHQVMLFKEIEMIEHYIGLEKLRYGDRLDIRFRMQGEAGDLQIAPLILYPFVENCFVHGAGEDSREPWIHIEIIVEGSQLRFYAANSVGDAERPGPEKPGPRANSNSVRRLEIQYPNSHRLTIKDRQHEHVVELNMRLT
jgi:LytS/YehU family sensor histidine kinase